MPVEDRSKVTIAVIDTGVDLDHPDLRDNLVAGYDFVNRDADPNDDNGHGTHVAGIAAAIPFNNQGIVGVAGGAKIMPVKVLNANGSGNSLDIYLGIMYAVKNGADVINMSLGSGAPSQLIKEAVEYALAQDVVVVAATGNDGWDVVGFPAAFDGVIGVGAIDWIGGFLFTNFSNYGPETDLMAPGVDIISIYPYELDLNDGNQDGYTLLRGTSMASPFVAGMAALLRAENRDLTYDEIQQALEANAYDLWLPGRDDSSGAGVINGSNDKNKQIPDRIEFPNIKMTFDEIDEDTGTITVMALTEKSFFSAFIDTEFNGDVSVSIKQVYSQPEGRYYIMSMAQNHDLSNALADSGTQAVNEVIITVPVRNGIGSYTIDIDKSGIYTFQLLAGESTQNHVLMRYNNIYPVLNGDAGISGSIILDSPSTEDLYVGLLAVNQYNWEEYSDMIPKGSTTLDYNIDLVRDKDYLLYYYITSDNDTYYNYGFYKDANTTTHDFYDTTLIDLTNGRKTDVNLYISTVDDLEDDVGDTPVAAEEITFEGLFDGDSYISMYKLDYKGDRDYFTFEIPKAGYYAFAAFPLDLYSSMRNMLYLYDSDKNEIVSERYEIGRYMAPGRYYLKIEDKTGLNVGDYVFYWGIPTPSEPEPFVFEDPALDAAIHHYFNRTVGEAVYVNELTYIETLDLSGLGISSLKGLEHLTNLWCLELRDNQVSDLTPLRNIYSLEVLDLKGNQVTDISPLCSLYNLGELDVSENRISVLPNDFSAMIWLYHIDLSHNEITSIKSLATLPAIEALFLQDNQITSLEGLAGLTGLEVLYLGNNPITQDPSTDYSTLASYYLKLQDKDFYALPTASNVRIEGATAIGSTLTGRYSYTNMNQHNESGTTYQWLRSTEMNGTYEVIPGATGRTYTLTASVLDHYIQFKVIPGAAGEPSTGLAAISQPVGPILTSSSGDSGDNGSGGSVPTQPAPSPSATPTPTVTPAVTPAPTLAPVPAVQVETDEDGRTTLVVDTTDLELSWDTAPVIQASSDSEVNGTRVNLTEDIFTQSNANNMPFTVSSDLVSFEIQPGTISIPEGTDSITLAVNYLTLEDVPEESRPTDATEVSFVFDFELLVDGKPVTTFDKPITITLKLDLSKVSNPDKVGIYYYSEAEGKWVFIGGKVNADGTVTFTTDHFSKYIAMESNKTFSDIQNHWAKDAIEVMAARHITNGTGDDRFSPDAKITRAEFTAMIVRALGITEKAGQNPFTDVKANDWFADSALKANAAGIIQGDAKGSFAPGNMITREEMAAIAVRAYSYYRGVNADRIITTQEVRFTDMETASQWARRSITLADALGLMSGFSDKTFRPKDLSSRAEAIVVVNRLMKLLEIF